MKIAFFGTDSFAKIILEELKTASIIPSLIVTVPDRPKGRNLIMTAPEVAVWAKENNIDYIQPDKLSSDLFKGDWDLFIVASYGKIIPGSILDIPKHKTLNVHPSLLPKLRGASPIETSILTENETGVTIMRIDEEMDHGPIIEQEMIDIPWPPYKDELEDLLAHTGGKLLAETIPLWIDGKIEEQEQNHDLATYTKKISKEDALLDLFDSPENNLRKIRAYNVWPRAYFIKDGKRVIITRANLKDGELLIEKVIPEGKKEMSYGDFLKGLPL
ncbi:MAG: methionyl-tRNA formyltransferase [Candidatus Pacebacteria bacterium]|nr:methionyl-tRNA formyltransferase [Candidatus Paceibacterota bacterium]